MMKFAEVFPDEAIVSTLWRQLSWSHFKAIIYLEKPLQRDFYAEMCRVEQFLRVGWQDVDVLRPGLLRTRCLPSLKP